MSVQKLALIIIDKLIDRLEQLKIECDRPSPENYLFWKQAEGLTYKELTQHIILKIC